MPEMVTLYKLIILYMLELVDFPLSNSQLSECILEKEYTGYFTIQHSLAQLCESELIREEPVNHRTLYHLTENGQESISYFRDKIPTAIRNEIKTYFEEKKYDLKREMEITANYYPNDSNEYNVHCRLTENGVPLIDLTVQAPSEDLASEMTANWYKNSQELYGLIMTKLL